MGRDGGCTAFQLVTRDGVLVGRNLDWAIGDGYLVVNPRGVAKTARVPAPDHPVSWTSRFGSVSFTQLGTDTPLGGLNEEGLVVEELSYWPARYPPRDGRPALDELEWIQYQLDTSATVSDFLDSLDRVRVSRLLFGLHYLVADRGGDVAVVEFLDGSPVVHRGDELPVAVLANDTYQNSVRYLPHHVGFGGERVVSDGPESPERFVRAALRVRGWAAAAPEDGREYAFETLRGVAQTDTQWSIVYELEEGRVSFHTLDQPSVRTVRLGELDLSGSGRPRAIDLNAPDPRPLVPWTAAREERLVTVVLDKLEAEMDLESDDRDHLQDRLLGAPPPP